MNWLLKASGVLYSILFATIANLKATDKSTAISFHVPYAPRSYLLVASFSSIDSKFHYDWREQQIELERQRRFEEQRRDRF
jgi:hypothetical protein